MDPERTGGGVLACSDAPHKAMLGHYRLMGRAAERDGLIRSTQPGDPHCSRRPAVRRRADAATPHGGGTCRVVCVTVRADVLPLGQWAKLSARCAAAIEGGAPPEKLIALRLASYHLQQAAFRNRELTIAYTPAIGAAIAEALGSALLETRRAAVGAARGGGEPCADPPLLVPPLRRLLDDGDPKLRGWAADALFALSLSGDAPNGLGTEGPRTVAALLKAIDDPDKDGPDAGVHGAGALGRSGARRCSRSGAPHQWRRVRRRRVGHTGTSAPRADRGRGGARTNRGTRQPG